MWRENAPIDRESPVRAPFRGGRGGVAGARPRRFTLIEMLVVIAVIAILAALLAPALRKALDAAKDLTCVNNLHQIGIAAQTYASDSEGRMPRAWQSAPQWRWQDALAPYCGVATAVGKECFAETHYVGDTPVRRGKGPLSCPAVTDAWIIMKKGTTSTSDPTTDLMMDYGMNVHLSHAAVARVRRPGRTFAFMDMCAPPGNYKSATAHLYGAGNDCWGDYWPMYDWATPRHRDKLYSNIVYADGHAETHLMPVMVNWEFRGGGNIPKNCSQQNFKAGVWWHYPH